MNRKKIMLITAEGVAIKAKKDSQIVLPWYLTNGLSASDVVAAYQAKGAGSYANSLENLVEDVYPLVPETDPPDWDNVNGWYNFNIIEASGFNLSDFTVICRYNDVEDMESSESALVELTDGVFLSAYIFGSFSTGGEPAVNYGFFGLDGCVIPSLSGGILAMTNNSSTQHIEGYRNGVFDGDSIVWDNSGFTKLTIGAPIHSMNIQAVALYNKILTPTQIVAITDNMNAIPTRYTLEVQNAGSGQSGTF